MRLSRNFTSEEFECKCGCGQANMSDVLIESLQLLRDLIALPITVTSGYRCIEHNKKVGGSKGSQHLTGRAADIKVDGMSSLELDSYVQAIPTFYDGGVGMYSSWVHVDVRGYRARW